MTSQAERIREQVRRQQESAATAQPSAVPEADTEVSAQPAPAPIRRATPPEVKGPARTTTGSRTPRLRPVRKNVDLSPDLNRRLGDWQRDTAIELGLARVTAQDVLTELLIELLGDPLLSERIKERLHASVDQ